MQDDDHSHQHTAQYGSSDEKRFHFGMRHKDQQYSDSSDYNTCTQVICQEESAQGQHAAHRQKQYHGLPLLYLPPYLDDQTGNEGDNSYLGNLRRLELCPRRAELQPPLRTVDRNTQRCRHQTH